MNDKPYVITINHLLGCGGSYVGKKLAEEFKIPFVDRDILKKVAEKLNVAEEDLEHREERLSTFWEEFTRLQLYSEPITGGGMNYYPSDKELFYMESEYIARIAKESPAIILGRGGWYVLRDHPRRFSLFVMADMPERIAHVASLFQIQNDEAKSRIQANDKNRAAYMKAFTKSDGFDVKLYDLSVNTSTLGLDTAVKIVSEAIRAKLKI